MSRRKPALPGTHLAVNGDELYELSCGDLPPALVKRATEALASLQNDGDRYVRRLAQEEVISQGGELEVDDGAVISDGPDNGAYVLAWKWVSFSGTPFDKDADWRAEVPSSADGWDLCVRSIYSGLAYVFHDDSMVCVASLTQAPRVRAELAAARAAGKGARPNAAKP